uniref:Kinetochore protein NDC80 n=1 Tax=Lygus hesperus TaxID=30085 RepID=A0A0K8SLD7_LYGHE
MKKSSLGRRNSNRPSTAIGRPSADVSSVRKSGIPVARSKSTERPSTMGNVSRMNRAGSSSNLHFLDMMTPAKTPLSSRLQPGQGTERPSRATGTSSIGTSSYGGGKTKRDNRPLQEKEWQAQAYLFIENMINLDPNGPNVLGPGLKPLSLNKFVDACDLLLKILDRSVEINKANYIKELPFLLGKKMLYKGKMEKSWMIAVNTQHAIPYALGLLHFLAQCANILINVDIGSLMFPCQFDNNQPVSDMNFQLLIPYYQHSYELRRTTPNYQDYQEELDQQVMRQHYEQDNALSRREAIAEEMENFQERLQKMEHEYELAQAEYEALEREYKSSSETIINKEDELVNCRITMSRCTSEASDTGRLINSIENELELLKEEHEKLLKKASEQTISHRDIEKVKKRRESVDREIISSQKYIQSYQDMIYTEDLEIIKFKAEIEELTRENNLRVMKYVPIEQEFEKIILPTKIEELDLSVSELQKEKIEKLKMDFSARAEKFVSEKSVAKHEREQTKKTLTELEASCGSQREKIESLRTEFDSIQDHLKKEQVFFEAELEKINSNIAALEKRNCDLQIEYDSKMELVIKRRKENEECEKIYEDSVKKLKEIVISGMQELKEIKKSTVKGEIRNQL